MITHDPLDRETLADVVRKLGGIPLDRIRFKPAPGTAVEQDVIDIHDRTNFLVELVDGVLVEKPTGYMESRVAALFIQVLGQFAEQNDIGIVAGADGMMRMTTGSVRMPDVSVVCWEQLPGRRVPREPIPSLAPELAVAVLSPSNTQAEMDRKLQEYFAAGTKCAWLVDPQERSVRVYASPTDFQRLTGQDLITAPDVLPGFSLSVDELFKRAGLA